MPIRGFSHDELSRVHRSDLLLLVAFALGYAATFLIPRRLDPWVARLFSTVHLLIFRRRPERTAAVMRSVLGPAASGVDINAAARALYTHRFEAMWGRVRGLHPRRWAPRLQVEGRQHVDVALEQGRGAIIWRMNMGDTLHLQRAAWGAGWPLVQLSSEGHGTKGSRLGVALLAPLYARAENAYLVERVELSLSRERSYMARLLAALHENQLVAILGEVPGTQNVFVPLFAQERPIATGAPGLAHRTGAALIPAYAVRLGRWHYRVVLGPPIDVDRSLERRDYVEAACIEFGRRLSAAILESPADYQQWWAGSDPHRSSLRPDNPPT